MTTDAQSIVSPPARRGPLAIRILAGMRSAVLRRVRGVALRVLDLETEFEVLDP